MLSPPCFSFAPKPQGPTERSKGSISEVIFSGRASDFCPPFSSMKMGRIHPNVMKHLTKTLGEQVKTAWRGAGVDGKVPGMMLGLRRCSDKVWGCSPETRPWFALISPGVLCLLHHSCLLPSSGTKGDPAPALPFTVPPFVGAPLPSGLLK